MQQCSSSCKKLYKGKGKRNSSIKQLRMKEIIVKKTHEITATEWQEITFAFNEEFKKEKTAADLLRFYNSNFKGYSYHGIAKDEHGLLAGFTAVNPTEYTGANGDKFFAGLSGSTFVRKDIRNDIFVFHDIYKALRVACANDGCKLILGVPNKNSFKYVVKLLDFKFLYNLPYHVLPLRVKNIFENKLIKLASGIIFLLTWLYVKFLSFISLLYNPKEKKAAFNIFYSDETYRLRFNESYKTIGKGPWQFTYRVYEEKNIRSAYLFDFRQKGQRSFRALSKAVNYIMGNEKIDMIAFVGKLDVSQPLLMQLPKSKEPQPLPLTIDILVAETDPCYAAYIKPESWNFGLMNFDVR